MGCNEKSRLSEEYENAAQVFADAVAHLRKNAGISTQAEYRRILLAADEARVASERVRLALERHTTEHGC